ncbi:COG7 [Auxenochlorella protothecoides x Auxenochlorella symbiontica]
MVELDAFEAPDFDPVTYVNDYCKKKSQDAPMDRYLTELELRLQLASEDIVGKLADASSRASLRVPSALKELLNIQSDLASAQASMAEVQERVNASAVGPGAQAVDTLRQLERVKGRMQTAADTLEEASGLASLFHRMDSLFADEDLPAIAAALAGMQRGLRVVGDSVPGFADGPARLATFQARLRDLVRAPLVAALQNRQGGEAQQLAGMLEGAGDGASLERLYCAAVLPPLRAAWEQVDPARAPFVSALPQFFEQVLGLLRGEAGWLAEAMPCRAPALLHALVTALFEAVEAEHGARLAAALAAPRGSPVPLERLAAARAAALDFVHGAAEAIVAAGQGGAAGVPPLEPLAELVLRPCEAALTGRYAALEGDALESAARAAVAALTAAASGGGAGAGAGGGPRGGAPTGGAGRAAPRAPAVEGLATALEAGAAGLAEAMHAALARCDLLSSHALLPELAGAADEAARQFLVAARGTLAARLAGAGEAGVPGAAAPSEAAAAAALEAVVPLVPASAAVGRRLAAVDAALRAAAAAVLDGDSGAGGSGRGAQPAAPWRYNPGAARLEAGGGAARDAIARLAPAAGRPTPALPEAMAGAAALQRLVHDAVLSTALARPRALFAGLPAAREYVAGDGAAAMPSFSAIPLPAVTAAGEYLLLLPQLLEAVLLRDEESAGAEDALASVNEWTSRVAAATAQELTQRLRQLPRLTRGGAGQLAADLEYFCNVLSTLGMEAPDALAGWAAGAAVQGEEPGEAAGDARAAFGELLAAAEGKEGRDAVRAVAALRGIQL